MTDEIHSRHPLFRHGKLQKLERCPRSLGLLRFCGAEVVTEKSESIPGTPLIDIDINGKYLPHPKLTISPDGTPRPTSSGAIEHSGSLDLFCSGSVFQPERLYEKKRLAPKQPKGCSSSWLLASLSFLFPPSVFPTYRSRHHTLPLRLDNVRDNDTLLYALRRLPTLRFIDDLEKNNNQYSNKHRQYPFD